MGYVTTRLVNLDGKLFEEGAPIRFGEAHDAAKAELVACGAVKETGKTADPESKTPPPEKSLSPGSGPGQGAAEELARMTKAELEAVAAAEGVDLAKAKTNGERYDAITAARAAKAAADATNATE